MLATLQASQAALVQAQKRLQAEATRDSLTGALNRRAGLEALTRELVRCRRQHRTLAVFVLDIDNFKHINDAYGHAAGDAVLRGLTTLLNRTLRPFDSVIRNGGDEFHLIAPGVGVSDALRLGERVLAQVRALHITSGQATLKFTASIGMACCSGELSAEDATAFADRALYRAKANGRDRIELEEAQTEPAADAAWPPEGRTFEVSGERPATVATQ